MKASRVNKTGSIVNNVSLPAIYDLRDWNNWNTTDQANVINTALSDVYSYGGGRLLIPSGRFSWGDKVWNHYHGVKLVGAGEGSINKFGTDAFYNAATQVQWIGASGGTACEVSPQLSEFTASFSGTVMTVTAVATGTISANDLIHINANATTYRISTTPGSGIGGIGTYNLTTSAGTIASSTCGATNTWQNQNLTDTEVSGLLFDGANLGGTGLLVKSTSWSKFKSSLANFNTINMDMDVHPSSTCPYYNYGHPVPGLHGFTDNQRNEIWYQGTNGGGAGIGFRVTGDQNGNTSFNRIKNIFQVPGTGVGVRYDNSDTNITDMINVYSSATYGVAFGGGGTATGCRWNRFNVISPGAGGLHAETGSVANYIESYDDTNGAPAPTKSGTATLFWYNASAPFTQHS